MAYEWSSKVADTIINSAQSGGLHPELADRWAYVPGMMLMAISRLGKLTSNEDYAQFVKKHMDLFVQKDGSIKGYAIEEYNLDQINQGKVLFHLWRETGEERYAAAAGLLQQQLASQPRTSEGGYWHKKIYPFQMWLDGIYMSSPFLAEYAAEFHQPELFDEVAHQILLIEHRTRDRDTGLLYHGWDESGEQRWCDPLTGRSLHFWSRAMGWYAMAVVDALEHFPIHHPKRGTIMGIFERMCGALEAVQGPNGLWYQVLDRGGQEGNYEETSGTSMFVYALAKGVRLGYLSPKFTAAALKGYEGLLAHKTSEDEQGVHVSGICLGAGLGGSPYRDGSYEYYVGEPEVSDVFIGVAPYLLACMEIERLNEGAIK